MSMTPKLLTIGGQTMSMKEWSRQPGAAPYLTICLRLKRGWDTEEAIFAPFGSRSSLGSSRASYVTYKRPPVRLRPSPHMPNPFRPCVGGFKSWPLEALPLLRRVA